jgi:hypothetical protein
MAVALRPAVLLIAFASLLFFAAGWLDSNSAFETCKAAPRPPECDIVALASIESWIFGAMNLVVAVLIARGSERILALRIGLAAFFMVERPVTAVAFGPKPIESIGLHMATAVVEAVILVSTLRIWRLGHSVSQSDLAFLSLPTPTPLAAAAGTAAEVPIAGPVPGVAVGPGRKGKEKRERPEKRPKADKPLDTRPRPTWGFGLIGALALLLALALLSDAIVRGIVPGAAVDLSSPDWLVYVFALVVLVVAARAVHQGRLAVRLLLVVALIVFVERAFTPFVLPDVDTTSIGLHAAAALVALALALTCAASLRSTRPRGPRGPLPL